MNYFIMAFSLSALCFSCIALCVAVSSHIKILAMEKSTHSIQYVPVDPDIDKANEEYTKQWATSEEALKKDRKLYKEELEDEMPEFSLTDDDKEIFSL